MKIMAKIITQKGMERSISTSRKPMNLTDMLALEIVYNSIVYNNPKLLSNTDRCHSKAHYPTEFINIVTQSHPLSGS